MEEMLKEMGAVGGVLRNAFDCMEIAEEEMEKAKVEIFMALTPPDGMSELAPWVYRAHARELCMRKRNAMDLRPGTAAECLTALSTILNEHPLTSIAQNLMQWCWVLCEGPKVEGIDVVYSTQLAFDYEDMCQKLAKEDRNGEAGS